MNNISDLVFEKYGKECTVVKEFSTGNYGKTYELLSEGESWVGKMIPADDKSRINDILQLQKHISNHGVFVPDPAYAKNGRLYDTFNYRDNEYLMLLYRKLSGENVEDRIDDYIEQDKLYDLGREVALLHQAMQSYNKNKLASVKKWQEADCLFTIFEEVDPDIDAGVLKRYEEIRNSLTETQDKDEEIIHSDLHFANVLYDKEMDRYKFIDLEDVVMGNIQMDLSILLFDLPVITNKEEKKQNILKGVIIEIIRGYNSIIHLNEMQIETIPSYLKLLEIASYINFYAYRDSDDIWLQTFYSGRKERILRNLPYVQFEVNRVLQNLGKGYSA
jgi:Ser/Thr protein kinase RdoA (MazF antagonist)